MTKKKRKNYGYSSDGIELTDDVLDKAVAEAEAGYDLSKLQIRRGRPTMGTGPAVVFQVRFEPELHKAVRECAEAEGVTPSEMVRRIVRAKVLPKRKPHSRERDSK